MGGGPPLLFTCPCSEPQPNPLLPPQQPCGGLTVTSENPEELASFSSPPVPPTSGCRLSLLLRVFDPFPIPEFFSQVSSDKEHGQRWPSNHNSQKGCEFYSLDTWITFTNHHAHRENLKFCFLRIHELPFPFDFSAGPTKLLAWCHIQGYVLCPKKSTDF